MESSRAEVSSTYNPKTLEELDIHQLCDVLKELGPDNLTKLGQASRNLAAKIEIIDGWNTYWQAQFERDFPKEAQLLGVVAEKEKLADHYYRGQYKQALTKRKSKQADLNMSPAMAKLFSSVRVDDLESIKAYVVEIDLAKQNIFMDVIDDEGNSLLGLAQTYARTEIVQFIYDRVCEVFFTKQLVDASERTQLYYAAVCGLLREIRELCTEDTVDKATRNGRTPLSAALMIGDLRIVKFLLDKKANLYYEGKSLLHIPVWYKRLTIVKYLFEDRGLSLDPNRLDSQGHSLLYLAARNNHLEMVEYLIERGADVTVANKDKDHETPLYQAAKNHNLAMVECLLKAVHGTDDMTAKEVRSSYVNARNAFCETAFFKALPSIEIMRCLVEHGADINVQNNFDWTPLHEAIRSKYREVVRYLLEKGAEVNPEVRHLGTIVLLHYAIINIPDMARELLAKGADANSKAWLGYTPLYHAVVDGGHDLDLVRDLLERGADVHQEYMGQSYIELARYSVQEKVADLLQFWGAKELSKSKPLNQQLIAVLDTAVTVGDTIRSIFFSEPIPMLIRKLGAMNGSSVEEVEAMKELIMENRKHISDNCLDFIDRYLLKGISKESAQLIATPPSPRGVSYGN